MATARHPPNFAPLLPFPPRHPSLSSLSFLKNDFSLLAIAFLVGQADTREINFPSAFNSSLVLPLCLLKRSAISFLAALSSAESASFTSSAQSSGVAP